MKAILLIIAMALPFLAMPARAQSTTATLTTCLSGQLLCSKACGKGPSAVPCINTCGMKAQMCASNNGRWPGAEVSDDEDRPAKSSSRRGQLAAEPEDEEAEPAKRSSSSSRSKGRSDGKCTTDAEFVHSWPIDKANDEFKFKFRVSSDNCNEYSCRGYIHYKIHYNYKSGGDNTKSTLVRYTIPNGQRSAEVTDKTFPSFAGAKLDIRDVEIGEVSCSSP